MSHAPSSRHLRQAAVTTAVASLVLAPATFLGAPAQAADPVDYVALGDSYSSGTGIRDYISDGTRCQRSTRAYPSLLAASRGYRLTFRACSGASVGEVRSTQLGAVTAETDVVTVTVGGNDAGFAEVLTQCALPSWLGNCTKALDNAQRIIANDLPGRWAGLLADVRGRAPGAKVVVVGYPRIFGSRNCNVLTWFTDAEKRRLNETADLLNAGMARAAGAAGGNASFSDPTSAFRGHAVCDSPEWVNGLSVPVSESFHPNASGHSGYAGVVTPALPGLPAPVDTRTGATVSAESIVAENRRFRALDATVTQEHFRAPDLTTPYARARAAKLGIDLNDPQWTNHPQQVTR